ncbi:DNA mismatch repair protein MutS [Rhodovastum atsumiense]|uniref:DNA mismatch repair protein MutS n=2 Tax=Rhodovastum atsumiense TaxID=504468 RepID=A0A5M6IXX3_9PROT|nr:DNA mismatch repair protein MutS [Rhodovastum atsumiense]
MPGPARSPAAEGATPAMAQWFAAKADHPDALVFFRMGDFYELFFGDAEAAAAALDIALTKRGEHAGEPIPMCGVPVHAAESYLARLIRRGFRVAVAEQMEDPKTRTGKTPIRREVVRLITPGTLTEEALLEPGRPNLLLALVPTEGRIGAAWLDVSTGAFETQALHADALPAALGRIDPAEILAPAVLPLGEWEGRRAPEQRATPAAVARRRLAETFHAASLDAFGNFSDVEAVAALQALDYVRATQAGKLPLLSRPAPLGEAGRLELDGATRASLEILRARDGGTTHTLVAAVQRTLTAAGARLLAEWLAAPLTDPAAIGARQESWAWLLVNPAAATALRAALRRAPDMARALARLSLGRGGPRDLGALRDGLAAAAEAEAALEGTLPALLAEARAALPVAPALRAELNAALAEPVPARLEDGAIATGFDAELDAERSLRDDSRRVVATLQLDYAQKYGVASLKIRHHAQLGYVIEAPAAAVEKLRAHPDLTLRQGMANGARFSSPELSDLDRRITEAADRAAVRERAVFAHLVTAALHESEVLAGCAAALALLDVAQSAAALAAPGTWCRPEVTDTAAFQVTAGRHPVVEAALAGTIAFVPNDCDLSPGRRVLLLTGPNMAGKSTYLRQNALIVVLAQAGLPVPATAARIGVVDRLFSRVGASDDLARGRSTFMVEMTETAAILHQAGPRSLAVIDEIGRGTATLDGLAIAWAVLEALHNAARCRVIFATHFHELARLEGELAHLAPYSMRVKEWKGEVVFLHEVAAGAAGRSWGVHVARLAGVPAPVVRRAGTLLAALERRAGDLTDAGALPLFAAATPAAAEPEPRPPATPETLPPADPLREELAAIDPDCLTPREALEALYRLRALLPPDSVPVTARIDPVQ